MCSDRFLIAVVDDDARVLESLDELLTSRGHEVLLYGSGEQFLQAGRIGQMDCLISDVGMPKMDGWELMNRARESHPKLPVILITGRHHERKTSGYHEEDMFYFLRKPFDYRELLRAMNQMLGRRDD